MSALEELLKRVESELHLVRRDLKHQLAPLRSAIDAYERAVEEDAVQAYCRDHSLKLPSLTGVNRQTAAHSIRKALEAIPDLSPGPRSTEVPRPSQSKESTNAPKPSAATSPAATDAISEQFRSRFPGLTHAAESGKLLVFGAFAGRTKDLPGPLSAVTEWIDTAHEGNRLVSNAVKRLRLGTVFAVIICDQAIQHQHAEPVVAEARSRGLPIGYAGKGGNGALARALEALEASLSGA